MTRHPTVCLYFLLVSGTVIACGPKPEEVVRTAFSAISSNNQTLLQRTVDPNYADGLGNRATLFDHIDTLTNLYERRELQLLSWKPSAQVSKATVWAEIEIQVNLAGTGPGVSAKGISKVELLRNGQFRIRSGLLTEVLDVLDTMRARRAALEANDLEALERLIHPQYKQGHYDKHRLLLALEKNLTGRVIRLEPIAYQVDLRRGLVHVDEHYHLVVDGQASPPSVARLTLTRSAGRLRIRAGLGGGAQSD